MRRTVVWLVVTAIGGVVLVAGGSVGGRAHDRDGTPVPVDHPLVGSWRVAGAFAGQGVGQPVAETTSLMTFTADGNVLVANPIQLPAVPVSSGLFFTEGQGSWTATGPRGGDATFVSLTLDQTGNLATTNTFRLRLEVDAAGTAAGSFVLDAMSGSGRAVGPQTRGTFRATRIEVISIDAPPATPAVGTPPP